MEKEDSLSSDALLFLYVKGVETEKNDDITTLTLEFIPGLDEETKTKAQQDISEDGYYGVKQTSQRMFDFASALAGDDVDKMREMQKAMQKGYKQAEKTWGGKLPEISQKTIEAANKLFEEYYKSKDSAQTAQDFANSEILNQAGTSQIR